MDVLNKNGKLSAMFIVSKLLGDDIFFFLDHEIVYDGQSHQLAGIQFNGDKLGLYPEIENNMDNFAYGVFECMCYVEQNDALKMDLTKINKSIHKFFRNENVTGMTVMNLFCEGLLKIESKEDGRYMVLVEDRLPKAMPDFKIVLTELLKTLAQYDGENYSENNYVICNMTNYDV